MNSKELWELDERKRSVGLEEEFGCGRLMLNGWFAVVVVDDDMDLDPKGDVHCILNSDAVAMMMMMIYSFLFFYRVSHILFLERALF